MSMNVLYMIIYRTPACHPFITFRTWYTPVQVVGDTLDPQEKVGVFLLFGKFWQLFLYSWYHNYMTLYMHIVCNVHYILSGLDILAFANVPCVIHVFDFWPVLSQVFLHHDMPVCCYRSNWYVCRLDILLASFNPLWLHGVRALNFSGLKYKIFQLMIINVAMLHIFTICGYYGTLIMLHAIIL